MANIAIRKRKYAKDPEKNKALAQAAYQRNRDKRLAKQKEYQQAHAEERSAYNQQWARENRAYLNEYNRAYNVEWKKRNPGKSAEYSRNARLRNLEEHRKTNAERELARRARKKASETEKISFDVVYERDQHICGICGKEVVDRADFQLDHIIPLSKGGPHTYANVQTSHRLCNQRKGNRV